MRKAVRQEIFAIGSEFAKEWAEYRSYLMYAGWGYATQRECMIAGQAVKMPRLQAMLHIDRMCICRDSRLRVAALMRVLNQPMITLRLGVTAMSWDVTMYLPRANGAGVTDYMLSTAEGRTGTISATYLNLMLTEAELYMDRGEDFAKARRVCSWGLSLLRKGVECESSIQGMFVADSMRIGHLLGVRYEGETLADAIAYENNAVDGVISVQRDFDMVMELMQGVCLN